MGNTGEAGRPPRKAHESGRSQPPDHATQDENVPPREFKPGLRDRDVDAIERELTDGDFGSPAQRARAENAMRRLADHALVEELRATDFAGPVFEVAQTELAAYGISVLMGWMRTGQIFARCQASGRPLSTSTPEWSPDDRLEIAIETTARGLRFFVDRVLKPGRWDYQRGTTLRTYFIGACLLQMRNVFDGWLTEQRHWSQVNDETPLDDAIGSGDLQWTDPTGDTVLRACTIREWLNSITDPKTRLAAWLVLAHQASHQEAGKAVGLSAGAVEGRLYRLRRSS